MEESYKEVYFSDYCSLCGYEDTDEGDDPCNDCLNNPMNAYSHKPVYWKEKKS